MVWWPTPLYCIAVQLMLCKSFCGCMAPKSLIWFGKGLASSKCNSWPVPTSLQQSLTPTSVESPRLLFQALYFCFVGCCLSRAPQDENKEKQGCKRDGLEQEECRLVLKQISELLISPEIHGWTTVSNQRTLSSPRCVIAELGKVVGQGRVPDTANTTLGEVI